MLPVLLFFCFLSQMLCAFLHQAEHWRHFWMYMGLLWGFNARYFLPARVPAWRQRLRAA
jgi:hypothetical protein